MTVNNNLILSDSGNLLIGLKNRLVETCELPQAGITQIGEFAFKNCVNLKKVILPNTVSGIGKGAFENCTSIEEISIPKEISYIEEFAFQGCTSLKTVRYLGSLENWLQIGFWGMCSNPCSAGPILYIDNEPLTKALIPRSCTIVPTRAFDAYAHLEEVILHEGVQEIGAGAFYGCGKLREIRLPKSLKKIRLDAFGEAEIERVYFDGSLEDWCNVDIENYEASPMNWGSQFYVQEKLIETLALPSALKVVNRYLFAGCMSIKQIRFPEKLETIKDGAFSNCPGLKKVTLPESLETIGEQAFGDCINLSGIRIPDSVQEICKEAFSGCEKLKRLYIPSSVQTMGALIAIYSHEELHFFLEESEKKSWNDVWSAKSAANQTFQVERNTPRWWYDEFIEKNKKR